MSSAVEETVKALVEFEKQLDQAKAEAADSVKKILKDAGAWAEAARTDGIARAQKVAADALSKAKAEAEAEAVVMAKKGETALKSFEASVSKKKQKAVEAVVASLLGESS